MKIEAFSGEGNKKCNRSGKLMGAHNLNLMVQLHPLHPFWRHPAQILWYIHYLHTKWLPTENLLDLSQDRHDHRIFSDESEYLSTFFFKDNPRGRIEFCILFFYTLKNAFLIARISSDPRILFVLTFSFPFSSTNFEKISKSL